MRKLSEIKGKEALKVLAKIVNEVSKICIDEEIISFAKASNKIKIVECLLDKYPDEILNVMAALEGIDPKEYEPSLTEIPKNILEMLNDPDLVMLFQSQDTVTSSGSATESTEATEKK